MQGEASRGMPYQVTSHLLILLCIPLVVPALALLNHRREPEEVSA